MSRQRDDRGAVAVMFGLTVVLLFSFAALAVDLGQAFVRKAEVQSGADLATLAGSLGNDLPTTGTSGTCSYGGRANASDPAVRDVAAYLNQNGYTGVTAGQLSDCSVKSNGEVFYGKPTRTGPDTWALGAYNKNQLTLVSPPKRVSFGFAGVIPGVARSVDVVGTSTVEIRTPKISTLPFYAYSSCDYGPQTLQQPNNGHSAATLQLYADGPSYYTTPTLTSITPTYYPAGTAAGSLQPLTIDGTNLAGVGEVGFFESGNGTAGPAPITSTAFVKTATTITFADLPDQTRGVTGVQNFWYIRVRATAGSGDWSKVVNTNGTLAAPMLTIGDPPLTCGQGSSAGNFGTLLFSKAGYNGADNVGAANVALGLDHALNVYPAGGPADGTCSGSQTTSVLWPTEGTNCVDTDTGMSAKVATGGFLGSGSSAPYCSYSPCGLLKKPYTTKCGLGGTPATTLINGQLYNNDTLSCFFTNTTVKVGDIDTRSYAGSAVLSPDIYNSPRFGWVPVLPVQPSNGGSNKYQIVDFRPCFLTNQLADAQKGDLPSASNGITMSGSSVQSVQVVFINPKALPVPPLTGGTVTYSGSGVKVPLLVN